MYIHKVKQKQTELMERFEVWSTNQRHTIFDHAKGRLIKTFKTELAALEAAKTLNFVHS